MKQELENIIFQLEEINRELSRNFGTNSYEIRKQISDIKDALTILNTKQ